MHSAHAVCNLSSTWVTAPWRSSLRSPVFDTHPADRGSRAALNGASHERQRHLDHRRRALLRRSGHLDRQRHLMTAHRWRIVHLVLTIAWTALVVPTLIWWKESILWVALMSCYANLAGHWAAYQAARSEDQ